MFESLIKTWAFGCSIFKILFVTKITLILKIKKVCNFFLNFESKVGRAYFMFELLRPSKNERE